MTRSCGLALALLLAAACASIRAPAIADARGALEFRRAASGLQYPHYRPEAMQSCAPAPESDVRQILVDRAAAEWSRFGYRFSRRADVQALSAAFPELQAVPAAPAPYTENDPLLLSVIGSYWAALSGVASSGVADVGGHEIAQRNARWRDNAAALRHNVGWATPWSAAFISFVACEAGLEGFRRSWAHRDYVDAAIAAADGAAAHPYHARETTHAPAIGDLLCAGREAYLPPDLEARRADFGAEGEMHCDLVVAIDATSGLTLAIGGNVENAVTLVPYRFEDGRVRSVCAEGRACDVKLERLFAVLELQAPQSAAALARAPALVSPLHISAPRFP